MPTLVERLNSLGMKKAIDVSSPTNFNKDSLSKNLSAEVIENQFGRVLKICNSYSYGYRHGDVEFIQDIDIHAIHKTGKITKPTDSINKLVFLDTETTGLNGGTGTLAFLVGIGRFDEKGFQLTQYMVEDPSEEAAMLLELSNDTENNEAVVTFNGKTFDMPLLKTRYILNKQPVPFSNWGHLDLLHLSRRIWRHRLSNLSLKDLEQEILHLPRSSDEVPGWMIPEIYFNFLHTGDGTQLKNVVYHNAMDIISLAALYLFISRMLQEIIFKNQIHDRDAFAIGQLYENIGEIEKAIEIYRYCLTTKVQGSSNIEIVLRLALLFKKKMNWDEAVPLWIEASESGNFDSNIELSKYYEHEVKEYDQAIHFTEKAEFILENATIPHYKKLTLKKELSIRMERLKKRKTNV